MWIVRTAVTITGLILHTFSPTADIFYFARGLHYYWCRGSCWRHSRTFLSYAAGKERDKWRSVFDYWFPLCRWNVRIVSLSRDIGRGRRLGDYGVTSLPLPSLWYLNKSLEEHPPSVKTTDRTLVFNRLMTTNDPPLRRIFLLRHFHHLYFTTGQFFLHVDFFLTLPYSYSDIIIFFGRGSLPRDEVLLFFSTSV